MFNESVALCSPIENSLAKSFLTRSQEKKKPDVMGKCSKSGSADSVTASPVVWSN